MFVLRVVFTARTIGRWLGSGGFSPLNVAGRSYGRFKQLEEKDVKAKVLLELDTSTMLLTWHLPLTGPDAWKVA